MIASTRNARRVIEGIVVSDKMAKTITILVERTYKHPKYKKYVRKQKRYHAHDENGEAKVGDRVEVRACRPMSKLKRWTLVRVVEKSKAAEVIDFGDVPQTTLGTEGGTGGGS
jgi:small subunit ribosomal protein S17